MRVLTSLWLLDVVCISKQLIDWLIDWLIDTDLWMDHLDFNLLLRSERSSSSCFLHRKNIDSLDCVCLQLDHSASRVCNHNALRPVHERSLLLVILEFLEIIGQNAIVFGDMYSRSGILLGRT